MTTQKPIDWNAPAIPPQEGKQYVMRDGRERRAMRRGCLCGYPDWPGQCPGPAACPVHGEHDNTEAENG